jgi:hypothetical protein
MRKPFPVLHKVNGEGGITRPAGYAIMLPVCGFRLRALRFGGDGIRTSSNLHDARAPRQIGGA